MRSASVLGLSMMAITTIGTNAQSVFESVGSRLGSTDGNPNEQHLRKLAEALDKYHAEKGSYPPPAITDKDGRPLLSWRVALLPYLGDTEKALYQEFRLDEPWDSLHNKKLLKKLPQSLRSPNTYGRFRTGTRLFTGSPGAVFDAKGARKGDLAPGSALVAFSDDSTVYWTKPADFTISEGRPLPEFFGKYGFGNLHVYFADGSYRSFNRETDEKILRALATRKGTQLEKPEKKD